MQTRWNSAAVYFFELFFRPWMRSRLSGIYITGMPPVLPSDRSVLLAANHVSWWDAFLLREVHRHGGGREPLITFMNARELRRFPFFRRMGVVGLGSTPGALRNALRNVAGLHARGPVWLTVFPQGHIWPSWKRPLAFRRGVVRFAETVSPVTILPVGIHLEPLIRAVPSAFIAVGGPIVMNEGTSIPLAALEARVAEALAFIHTHLAEYGETAPKHWPPIHEPLPVSTASIYAPLTTQPQV